MATEFDINFDTDLSELSGDSGTADFAHNTASPIHGAGDLKVTCNDTTHDYGYKYVADTGQTQFRDRVYIDLSNLTMSNGSEHYIKYWRGDNSTPDAQVQLRINYTTANGFRIRMLIYHVDGSLAYSGYTGTVSAGLHYVELHIEKESSASGGDGTAYLYIDQTATPDLSYTTWQNYEEFEDCTTQFHFYLSNYGWDSGTSGYVQYDSWKCNNDGGAIGAVSTYRAQVI